MGQRLKKPLKSFYVYLFYLKYKEKDKIRSTIRPSSTTKSSVEMHFHSINEAETLVLPSPSTLLQIPKETSKFQGQNPPKRL